jgi:cytochrome c biogenesis protein CcmG/thiol:disulfide interchange protein DsbE
VKKRILTIIAVVLVLEAYSLKQDFATSGVAGQGNAAATHRLAPRFALPDLNGRKIDLAAYQGHVVLLNFWATWCTPCRAEMPELIYLQNQYRSRGFRVIGISLDDDAKPARDFSQQLRINYPIVIGDADLAERYGGVLGLPASFLIDCNSSIRTRYDGKIDLAHVERELKSLLQAKSCAGK